MRHLRALAALMVLLASTGAVSAQPYYRGWVNLFEPPYSQCPTIMLGIACVSSESCFIPGGANGVGFDVFNFNGSYNGNFQGLYMPKMPMMLMSIGAGGTTAHPHGATAGFGIGDGVQYIANASTMLPATGADVFFVISQDTRASRDGSKIIIMDQFDNSVLVSTDHGKTFAKSLINTDVPFPNNTEVRYGAFGDDQTWYVTMGSWPGTGANNGALRQHIRKHGRAPENYRHELSNKHSLEVGDNGRKIRRHMKKRLGKAAADKAPTLDASSSSSSGEYLNSAVISRTTDGGKTWHNVLYDAGNYYLNGIDCASATHCIAVGEGFDLDPAAHVFLTTTGLYFEEVLRLPSNDSVQMSLMSVHFNGPNEAWVAGGAETPTGGSSLFFYTNDGGHTWTQHAMLPNVMDIADMSFVNGTGFAVALTAFDDSTVLRYDSKGPSPTPAPPPWVGNFTQISCNDQNCQVGCQSSSFPQNTCLGLNGGGSALAQCGPGVLVMQVFPLSANCTGPSVSEQQATNQCLQAQQGGSFETFCGPAPTSRPGRRAPRKGNKPLKRQQRKMI